MFNKLKQFKDLRERAKTLQASLAEEHVEGSAGWGKVKVIMDGNQQIVSVTIDPELMSDKGKLEGFVKEAVNEAVQKIQRLMSTKLKDLGGLDLAQDMQEMIKK